MRDDRANADHLLDALMEMRLRAERAESRLAYIQEILDSWDATINPLEIFDAINAVLDHDE